MLDNPGEGKSTINNINELEKYLDPEIKNLILFLKSHHFDTFTSCSGKPGHAFSKPTIRFNLNYHDEILQKERYRLRNLLNSKGYAGYTLSEHFEYDGTQFLQLEFYDLLSLIP